MAEKGRKHGETIIPFLVVLLMSWLPSTFTRLTENEREIFVKNYRWLLEIKYENTKDNGFITMKIREKGESILGIKIIRCIQFFVENSIRAHHLT